MLIFFLFQNTTMLTKVSIKYQIPNPFTRHHTIHSSCQLKSQDLTTMNPNKHQSFAPLSKTYTIKVVPHTARDLLTLLSAE